MKLVLIMSAVALTGATALFISGPQIPWRHENGLSERRRMPENMGPGVAVIDYNQDGRMDLAFPTALFRNEGNGAFKDVTSMAGIDTKVFGIGVAAADFDSDGWMDLAVTTWGKPLLYRNLGNGRFEKRSIGPEGLWTVPLFFDADNDGHMDLFVGHFAEYDEAREPECKYNNVFHYCHPLSYPLHRSLFLKNIGSGKFEPLENAMSSLPGKVFGAVATDLNGDGLLDVFVANDSVANFLFMNQGAFQFREIGMNAGVAYSSDGNPRSGMGVDAADYDGDGKQDLFVANFNRERFSIYRNLGNETFEDEAGSTGIGVATQMYSGWGVRFFDRDHDGDEDLIVVNGHPDDRIETLSQTLKWKEPVLFFENRQGKFVPSTIVEALPARGLALADLDNDGAMDVIIANNGSDPVVLRGQLAAGRHWIGIDHKQLTAGSMVRWHAGGKTHLKRVNAGGSYLSTSDPRMVIGLDQASEVDWLEILRPKVPVERYGKLKADRYHALGR